MSVLSIDFAQFGHESIKRVAEHITKCIEPKPIFTHPRILKILNVPQIGQRTPEWYACRNKVLTASDAGTVLGINPFTTRRALLERKLMARVGLASASQQMDKMGIIACEHGEKYEDEAAREYFERYPENGILFNFGLVRHDTLPWLAGSPDRVTQNGILLEIKVGWLLHFVACFVVGSSLAVKPSDSKVGKLTHIKTPPRQTSRRQSKIVFHCSQSNKQR